MLGRNAWWNDPRAYECACAWNHDSCATDSCANSGADSAPNTGTHAFPNAATNAGSNAESNARQRKRQRQRQPSASSLLVCLWRVRNGCERLRY